MMIPGMCSLSIVPDLHDGVYGCHGNQYDRLWFPWQLKIRCRTKSGVFKRISLSQRWLLDVVSHPHPTPDGVASALGKGSYGIENESLFHQPAPVRETDPRF
jgi:hypothetical protein